jgi:hypothetical protein
MCCLDESVINIYIYLISLFFLQGGGSVKYVYISTVAALPRSTIISIVFFCVYCAFFFSKEFLKLFFLFSTFFAERKTSGGIGPIRDSPSTAAPYCLTCSLCTLFFFVTCSQSLPFFTTSNHDVVVCGSSSTSSFILLPIRLLFFFIFIFFLLLFLCCLSTNHHVSTSSSHR